MNTINGTSDQPFHLLDTGDDALFNQLQTLMAIARQNQEDIQRILKLLEPNLASASASASPPPLSTHDIENHSQQKQKQKQKQKHPRNGGDPLENENHAALATASRTSLDMITEE
jgi:hypothetical protein